MISIPNHITKGAFRKVKCVCLPKDGTKNHAYIIYIHHTYSIIHQKLYIICMHALKYP